MVCFCQSQTKELLRQVLSQIRRNGKWLVRATMAHYGHTLVLLPLPLPLLLLLAAVIGGCRCRQSAAGGRRCWKHIFGACQCFFFCDANNIFLITRHHAAGAAHVLFWC